MSNEHIIENISDYLERKNTDYSLLLTGDWGIGKTWFVTHDLKTKIEKESSYKLVLVSLFGMQKKEEIFDKLLYKLDDAHIPRTRVPVRTALNSTANGFRKISKTVQAGIYGVGVSITLPSASEFLLMKCSEDNLKKSLIVLDDMERCDIDPVELLGTVDTLLNMGCKVIVVANEKEFLKVNEMDYKDNEGVNVDLQKIKQEKYDRMKEKIFTRTIFFQIDSDKVFENLVNEIFDGSDTFEIVKSAKKEIINILNEYVDILSLNARSLRECCYIFKKVSKVLREIKIGKDQKRILFVKIFFQCLLYKKHPKLFNESDQAYSNRNKDIRNDKTTLTDRELTKYQFEKRFKNLQTRTNLLGYYSILKLIRTGVLENENLKREINILSANDFIYILKNWFIAPNRETLLKAEAEFWKKVKTNQITLEITREIFPILLGLAEKNILQSNFEQTKTKIIECMPYYLWNVNELNNFYLWISELDSDLMKKTFQMIEDAFHEENKKRLGKLQEDLLYKIFRDGQEVTAIDMMIFSASENNDLLFKLELFEELLRAGLMNKKLEHIKRINYVLHFCKRKRMHIQNGVNDVVYFSKLCDLLKETGKSEDPFYNYYYECIMEDSEKQVSMLEDSRRDG